MTNRIASINRSTNETVISASIDLDGSGESRIKTGIGFLDHMLDALARHSGIDIELSCEGDLIVDDHHSVEDCAIVLGRAIADALGERVGIARFASAYAPLDESLSRCVIDFSGRPFAHVELGFVREQIGRVATENLTHFFETIAVSMRATIHVDLVRGQNDHHKSESAFKAFALALRDATRITQAGTMPSTKGTLS
jgi:imidazoleglycerol-phosphate dehydratase